MTFEKQGIKNIKLIKNNMQKNWDDGLDEFLYSQTLAGREELADERAEREAQKNDEEEEE